MRILLIDDDKDDQALFCDAIAQLSADLICDLANNGIEGLQYLQTTRTLPDVIFLDINMPMMDGRETLKIIRGTPRINHIPVVMYSTSIAPDELGHFTRLNAACVTKPNNFNNLASLLSEQLMSLAGSSNENLIRY